MSLRHGGFHTYGFFSRMNDHVSWSVFDPEDTSAMHIGATGWVGWQDASPPW